MINPAVTYAAAEHQGRLFWITCKRLKLLRKTSHLQVIQNSPPSVVRRRQCDIRIDIFCKMSCEIIEVEKFPCDFRKTFILMLLG